MIRKDNKFYLETMFSVILLQWYGCSWETYTRIVYILYFMSYRMVPGQGTYQTAMSLHRTCALCCNTYIVWDAHLNAASEIVCMPQYELARVAS